MPHLAYGAAHLSPPRAVHGLHTFGRVLTRTHRSHAQPSLPSVQVRAEKEALSKKLKQMESKIMKGEARGGLEHVTKKKEEELRRKEEELERRRAHEEEERQRMVRLPGFPTYQPIHYAFAHMACMWVPERAEGVTLSHWMPTL